MTTHNPVTKLIRSRAYHRGKPIGIPVKSTRWFDHFGPHNCGPEDILVVTTYFLHYFFPFKGKDCDFVGDDEPCKLRAELYASNTNFNDKAIGMP